MLESNTLGAKTLGPARGAGVGSAGEVGRPRPASPVARRRGGEEGALVNSRESVASSLPRDRSKALRDAYDLAWVVRSMGLNDNLNYCLNAVSPMADAWGFRQSPSKQRARIKGLAVCRLYWLCPLCAVRVGESRRAELEFSIAEMRRPTEMRPQGGEVYFGTLTLAHTRWDSLQDSLTFLRAAWRALQQYDGGRAFRRLLDEYGIVGFIRSLEATWGALNSWHPHFHFLWFARAPLSPEQLLRFRRRLYCLWLRTLRKSGRSCSYKHGVYLVRSFGSVQEYVDKWGKMPERRKWSSADELTRWYRKKGRNKGFSPFELARAYGDTPESDTAARQLYWALFSEYAAAFSRKAQLYWSSGLRDLLSLSPSSDSSLFDSPLSSDESDLVYFPPSDFAGVRHFKTLPHLHSVADRGNVSLARAVVAFANTRLASCSCPSCLSRRSSCSSVDVYTPEVP